MAVELGVGYVNLVASARGIAASIAQELGRPFSSAAQTAGEDAGKKLAGGLLDGAKGSGKKLLETLGLLTLGAFAIKSAVDVEDAQNIITRSTGATGKALEGLQASFKNVASTSGASLETIASTLAQVSQNTGLTGKALETLTSQVVTFNRISKDSPITVDALTHALAGFNVPGAQMGRVLDELFKISQKTGVPLADLLATLQTAGPIARQFGFSVEFTATLLAQLTKAGLDANQILPGLRKAFVDFAKDGREPGVALRETLTSIQDLIKAGDIAGARQLAVQIFGARGSGLVDAAISGKLSLDQLGTSVSLAGAGILDTASKTGTLGGALATLRNISKLAFAEFATPAIQAANDALRRILPTVRSIGDEFATLPSGVKLTVAGLIGLTALAGPLGNLGQGVSGLKDLSKGFGDLVSKIREVQFAEIAAQAVALWPVALAVGVGVAVGELGHLAFGTDDLTGKMKEALAAGDRFGKVLIAGAKGAHAEIPQLNSDLKVLNKDLKSAGDFESFLKTAGAIRTVNGEMQRATQATHEQAAADETTKKSLEDYGNALRSESDQQGTFAKLTDDATKALQAQESAFLAAQGGAAGYQAAQLALQGDQYALAQLEASGTATEYELAGARNRVEQDTLAVAAAAVKAHDDQDAFAASLKDKSVPGLIDLRQKLSDSAAAYGDNTGAIAGEITKIDDLLAFLARIPSEKTTTVTANTEQAQGAIDRFLVKIAQIPGGGNFSFLFTPPATAVGGIFNQPQVRLFAEAGPEAVLPLSDPRRAWDLIAQSGLLGAVQIPAQSQGNRGLTIEHATFGDRDVVRQLDYWSQVKSAGT